MKFYYVALTINKEEPVRTQGGKRLAYYTKRYQTINQCEILNNSVLGWRDIIKSKNKELPYKVYCVESEPMEVTSE